MDNYKYEMQKKVGVGGLNCSCCNNYCGKYRTILNRLARRTLKHKDSIQFKKIIAEL